jgi:Rrf2 family protein
MRLSLRGEYALRALIALGETYDGDVTSMQVISEQQEIPKRFLELILNDLRASGFVESKRGIAGGYRLARLPEDITLAQVIRHVEGTLTPPANLNRRTSKLNPEANGSQLAIRTVMKDVRDAIVKVLDDVTLGDLCARSRQLRGDPVGSFDYAI